MNSRTDIVKFLSNLHDGGIEDFRVKNANIQFKIFIYWAVAFNKEFEYFTLRFNEVIEYKFLDWDNNLIMDHNEINQLDLELTSAKSNADSIEILCFIHRLDKSTFGGSLFINSESLQVFIQDGKEISLKEFHKTIDKYDFGFSKK